MTTNVDVATGGKWRWSDALGVWAWQENYGAPPIGFCLGKRLLTLEDGADLTRICWRGSHVDNWHGYSFGIDLKEAIEWLLKDNDDAPCHCAWPALKGMKHPPHTCRVYYANNGR